jgi:hypothetical protein
MPVDGRFGSHCSEKARIKIRHAIEATPFRLKRPGALSVTGASVVKGLTLRRDRPEPRHPPLPSRQQSGSTRRLYAVVRASVSNLEARRKRKGAAVGTPFASNV